MRVIPLLRSLSRIQPQPILRRCTAPLNLNRLQPKPILRPFATHHGGERQQLPVRKIQKKALIIGIQYGDTNQKLINPHADAKLWRDLLTRRYGFDEKNIVMMLDDGDNPSLLPTKENILREIANFVRGVDFGDELVFYYSGHTGQSPTDDPNEDDGLNEFLIPVDEEPIVDNDLRTSLVDELPIGSKLTAIFDSCHSGTLLDLDHYLCNEIYHPFICRAPSSQKSRWMDVRRKNAAHDMSDWAVDEKAVLVPAAAGRPGSKEGTRIHQRLRESSEKVSCIDTALTRLPDNENKQRRFQVEKREHTSTHAPSRANTEPSSPESAHAGGNAARTDTPQTEPVKRTSVQIRQTSAQTENRAGKTRRTTTRQNSLNSVLSSVGFCPRTASPEPLDATPCAEGGCVVTRVPLALRPDVTSLAACHDPQEAYDGRDGQSMTKILVEILDKDPHPTYATLVRALADKSCRRVKDIQKRNTKRKALNAKRKPEKKRRVLNHVDWSVPQLGSLMPGVLNCRFMKRDTPK